MLKTLYYRSYQFVLKLAAYFLGIKEPEIISGPGEMLNSFEVIKKHGLSRPLIVTDKGLHELGLVNSLLSKLKEDKVKFGYFYDVVANPTIENVKNGVKVYKENICDSIIVIGGGSAIDAAKLIGASIVCPNKEIAKMGGLLKVR